MGVLLQAFYTHSGGKGVPCPLDGDHGAPFWWDHLAAQRPDFVMANPNNIPGSKTTWAQGIATHDDMIAKFGTLAFVAPATAGGQTVFVKEP